MSKRADVERWECRPCRRTLQVQFHTGAPRMLVRRCRSCDCEMRRLHDASDEDMRQCEVLFETLLKIADLA